MEREVLGEGDLGVLVISQKTNKDHFHLCRIADLLHLTSPTASPHDNYPYHAQRHHSQYRFPTLLKWHSLILSIELF